MMIAAQLMTIEEVEAMGPAAERYELIRGVLRELEGMSEKHGMFAGRLHVYVGGFVLEHNLGEVLNSDTRFTFPGDPPSWAAPDVAFVSAAGLPLSDLAEGYSRRIPDLAAEVKSPLNTEAEVLEKISVYLPRGVRLVWLVRPIERTVTVFRPRGPEQILAEHDVLDGEDVLPGFRPHYAISFVVPAGTWQSKDYLLHATAASTSSRPAPSSPA
jgi:Uma2 family endonuclease